MCSRGHPTQDTYMGVYPFRPKCEKRAWFSFWFRVENSHNGGSPQKTQTHEFVFDTLANQKTSPHVWLVPPFGSSTCLVFDRKMTGVSSIWFLHCPFRLPSKPAQKVSPPPKQKGGRRAAYIQDFPSGATPPKPAASPRLGAALLRGLQGRGDRLLRCLGMTDLGSSGGNGSEHQSCQVFPDSPAHTWMDKIVDVKNRRIL